ncbi:MAG: hypothetical protein ACK5D5_05675 [Bacteroidota bacterium]
MNTEYKLSGRSGSIFTFGLLIGLILTFLLSLIYSNGSIYIHEAIFCEDCN